MIHIRWGICLLLCSMAVAGDLDPWRCRIYTMGLSSNRICWTYVITNPHTNKLRAYTLALENALCALKLYDSNGALWEIQLPPILYSIDVDRARALSFNDLLAPGESLYLSSWLEGFISTNNLPPSTEKIPEYFRYELNTRELDFLDESFKFAGYARFVGNGMVRVTTNCSPITIECE